VLLSNRLRLLDARSQVGFFGGLLRSVLAFMGEDEKRVAGRQKLARELHLVDACFWALACPFRPGRYDVNEAGRHAVSLPEGVPNPVIGAVQQAQVRTAGLIAQRKRPRS
jgi:hypothetical protein